MAPRMRPAVAFRCLLVSVAVMQAALWEGPAEQRILDTFGGDATFLWGSATASYQVEGAWDRDGRQASIWDDFSHSPGHTYNNETGDVADDFYDKWESDIDRIVAYKFNAFRM